MPIKLATTTELWGGGDSGDRVGWGGEGKEKEERNPKESTEEVKK